GANDVAQLLRVNPPGQGREADEVDENDSKLAAFRSVSRFRRHGSSRGVDGLRRGSGPADGSKDLPPVPERNTDVLEILVSQIGQYRDINFILGKPRSV